MKFFLFFYLLANSYISTASDAPNPVQRQSTVPLLIIPGQKNSNNIRSSMTPRTRGKTFATMGRASSNLRQEIQETKDCRIEFPHTPLPERHSVRNLRNFFEPQQTESSEEVWELEDKKYLVEKLPFAAGGEKQVFKAIQKGQPFVIAVYHSPAQKDEKSFYAKFIPISNETKLRLALPTRANPYKHPKTGRETYVMRKYRGDLFSLEQLPTEEKIIKQLAPSLAAMHTEGFIHRDIKPDNIFMGKKELYLGDFGSVTKIKEGEEFPSNIHNTPEYSPPEWFLLEEIQLLSNGQRNPTRLKKLKKILSDLYDKLKEDLNLQTNEEAYKALEESMDFYRLGKSAFIAAMPEQERARYLQDQRKTYLNLIETNVPSSNPSQWMGIANMLYGKRNLEKTLGLLEADPALRLLNARKIINDANSNGNSSPK